MVDTGAELILQRASAELARPMSVVEVQAQINVIKQLMTNNMKDGTHFGKVFATAKPSLWKPGAEMIASTFHLATDPIIEDLSTPDEIRYRVRVNVTRQGDGLFLGAALGECSSHEQKYMYREAVVQAEWDATPEDRRRLKYEKKSNKAGFDLLHQVRTHPPDVANTILKMAHKRALIAAILVVTAASDVFTQDIEDLPKEMQASLAEEQGTVSVEGQPQRASEVKAKTAEREPGSDDADEDVYEVVSCRVAKTVAEERDGQNKVTKKGWTLFKFKTSDGVERASFSKTAYENAERALREKKKIRFTGKENGEKGYEVTAVEVVE